MIGFAPGPWFAAPYSSVVGIGVLGKGGRVICSVAVQPGFNPNGPHEGKREIAAGVDGASAAKIARNAITKARGETPNDGSIPSEGSGL